MMPMQLFADEVGAHDPITVAGGRRHWSVGGAVSARAREVRAPSGVYDHNPAEMTVRAGAGTTLAEFHGELAHSGQTTILDGPAEATIGGILMVGRSGLRRLREGPVRDALLQARYVSSEGEIVTCGGPTVKNVTGYDLCRLFIGSLGVLGCVGEVILRTRPLPAASQWWSGPFDPFVARARLYRPSAVLWDGGISWVLLEGHPVDVNAEGAVLRGLGAEPVEGPPPLGPVRSSVAPQAVGEVVASGQAGRCVVEVGVGVVHGERALPSLPPAARVVDLHMRLRAEFDPARRLNPGRDPLAIGHAECAE